MDRSLSKVLKRRLASRLNVGALTGSPSDQVLIFIVFSLCLRKQMFPLGSDQSDESLGASLAASTTIRQLAVESLKSLFTSFFYVCESCGLVP